MRYYHMDELDEFKWKWLLSEQSSSKGRASPKLVAEYGDQLESRQLPDDGVTVVELPDRTEWWYGERLHRRDGPAIVRANGSEEWWQDGRLHRRDGLPAVVRADGSREWWQYGELHRCNGPAVIEKDGRQEWWLNGHPIRPALAAGMMRRSLPLPPPPPPPPHSGKMERRHYFWVLAAVSVTLVALVTFLSSLM